MDFKTPRFYSHYAVFVDDHREQARSYIEQFGGERNQCFCLS